MPEHATSLDELVLREAYRKVRGMGVRLEKMKWMINWKPFIPIPWNSGSMSPLHP